ncbi:uncharacterized protein LOC124160922 [Ischnura elegans]|uniref:uncharacterized protein LOC124160922 n=1 Tax=Ischnura elegans TaxID=197161 RepID=UPI001ED86A51|nr:uncharacterized protein LOC124160922 [Ischnura elegans]
MKGVTRTFVRMPKTDCMDYGNAWEDEERRHHSLTHCRQHNVSSMEERNQYHRRTGYLGGMVTGETQTQSEERRMAADVTADVHEYEAMTRDLKILEKKRKSLMRAYNEGLERLSNLNVQFQFVRIPHRRELDDVTHKINVIKLQLSQMDKYYGIDIQNGIHSR